MGSKVSVFIATSLDGYISRKDGNIDWLMDANSLAPQGEDCGYKEFIETVDVLIMGRNTYEKVLSFDDWPYGDLQVVVLASKEVPIPDKLKNTVSVRSEKPSTLLRILSKDKPKHFYVDGGLTIQSFFKEGLIDEITITTIPVLIGEGRALFGELEKDISLKHINGKIYDFGFVQNRYAVIK